MPFSGQSALWLNLSKPPVCNTPLHSKKPLDESHNLQSHLPLSCARQSASINVFDHVLEMLKCAQVRARVISSGMIFMDL